MDIDILNNKNVSSYIKSHKRLFQIGQESDCIFYKLFEKINSSLCSEILHIAGLHKIQTIQEFKIFFDSNIENGVKLFPDVRQKNITMMYLGFLIVLSTITDDNFDKFIEEFDSYTEEISIIKNWRREKGIMKIPLYSQQPCLPQQQI